VCDMNLETEDSRDTLYYPADMILLPSSPLSLQQ
jgi:hypothetical protein